MLQAAWLKKEINATRTDAAGRFNFNNLDKGHYSIRIEDGHSDQYTELVMEDDLNVPYESASSNSMNADGSFKFSKLPAQEIHMQRMIEEDFNNDDTDFTKLVTGEPVILKHVYFETGQGQLKEQSNSELDELTEYLKEHSEIRVKVAGHTDNTGGSKLNQQLSENRAKSVYDYLAAKGIESGRLSYEGFGASKHIVSNISEEGRKQNRRVEVVVMK